MAQIDYYQVLGINPSASRQEIRVAYRRLARRHHPDTNPDWEDDAQATQRMALLNEAYAVLQDPEKRVAYDRQRRQFFAQQTQRARNYERARARRQSHTFYSQRSAYTAAGTRARKKADPFAEPPDGWPELRFYTLQGQLILIGSVCMILSLLSVCVLQTALFWTGVAFAASSFLAGTLSFLAAIPYFQGYVLLARDRMVEYGPFGLFAPREYTYEQICGVHEQIFRHRSGVTRYIVIDYFKQDDTGQLDLTRYYSKRLIRVSDHYVLLHLLRVRAKARKFPFAKPTWSAFLLGSWEWLAPLLLLMGIGFFAALFMAFHF